MEHEHFYSRNKCKIVEKYATKITRPLCLIIFSFSLSKGQVQWRLLRCVVQLKFSEYFETCSKLFTYVFRYYILKVFKRHKKSPLYTKNGRSMNFFFIKILTVFFFDCRHSFSVMFLILVFLR